MPARWIGNPQPDQFVRVSSELLVAIARTPTNDREHRLLMAIVAATYGRFSDHVRITRVQLGQLTALTAPQVLKGLAELQARGIIVMGTPERGKPVRIQLVKAYTKWQDGPPIDLAVEDVWRGIPRGAREVGQEPEDEHEQVSHGKVSDAPIDASAPDPDAPKKREVETRPAPPDTRLSPAVARELARRIHDRDQLLAEIRQAQLAGQSPEQIAAIMEWAAEHFPDGPPTGARSAAPTHPAKAGRGSRATMPPGGLPRTTPTATHAASRAAVDPARGSKAPSAPPSNLSHTNAAPPGQPNGARTPA